MQRATITSFKISKSHRPGARFLVAAALVFISLLGEVARPQGTQLSSNMFLPGGYMKLLRLKLDVEPAGKENLAALQNLRDRSLELSPTLERRTAESLRSHFNQLISRLSSIRSFQFECNEQELDKTMVGRNELLLLSREGFEFRFDRSRRKGCAALDITRLEVHPTSRPERIRLLIDSRFAVVGTCKATQFETFFGYWAERDIVCILDHDQGEIVFNVKR
jgi:hypothetical protein